MDNLIFSLKKDFPKLNFKSDDACFWSPKTQTISFNQKSSKPSGVWAVLHELGHAILKHDSYSSDFELLLLEVAAWDKAQELAAIYGHEISEDHIQNCLDTYRDWLHRRSTCPSCNSGCSQQDSTTYACFNCQTSWQVTAARFCRPYRKLTKEVTQTPVSRYLIFS